MITLNRVDLIKNKKIKHLLSGTILTLTIIYSSKFKIFSYLPRKLKTNTHNPYKTIKIIHKLLYKCALNYFQAPKPNFAKTHKAIHQNEH